MSNRMWGGRFAEGPWAIMQAINASIGFDAKMWRQDIRGSLAHAAMLAHVGIISADDEAAIKRGLGEIAQEIEAGRFEWSEALEDVHMNIEARLTERIGEAGKRLHTARSRNDQVATDFRLWTRDAMDGLAAQMLDCVRAFVARAEEHAGTIMPGYTHLQPAQPRPSATTCWPMPRCSGATAAACSMPAPGSTRARWARPPCAARASRRIAT
jgi:argininosuccinate lyase